jgi:hypothetical protein
MLIKLSKVWHGDSPVILVTQEAEIRMIVVGSQLGEIVPETLSQKYPTQNRADGVACLASMRP